MTPLDLNVIGLVLSTVGAAIAAFAVILTDDQAEKLSGTYYNGNKALKESLLHQSRKAKQGLMLVMLGFAFQMFAAGWEKAISLGLI